MSNLGHLTDQMSSVRFGLLDARTSPKNPKTLKAQTMPAHGFQKRSKSTAFGDEASTLVLPDSVEQEPTSQAAPHALHQV
jgi:hypothetical protein